MASAAFLLGGGRGGFATRGGLLRVLAADGGEGRGGDESGDYEEHDQLLHRKSSFPEVQTIGILNMPSYPGCGRGNASSRRGHDWKRVGSVNQLDLDVCLALGLFAARLDRDLANVGGA